MSATATVDAAATSPTSPAKPREENTFGEQLERLAQGSNEKREDPKGDKKELSGSFGGMKRVGSAGNNPYDAFVSEHVAFINDPLLVVPTRLQGILPLEIAAGAGNPGLVTAMVKYGADVNKENFSGKGPLVAAAASMEGGADECIKIMLARGGDPNVCDVQGRTPLFVARQARVVQALMEGGADANARDHQGRTPLHCVPTAAAAKALVAAGADVGAKDSDNNPVSSNPHAAPGAADGDEISGPCCAVM